MLRDAHQCGTDYMGKPPVKRIIDSCCIVKRNGVEYLHYRKKVAENIVSFLLLRYNQYRHVYLHKSVVAAAILLREMIHYAVKPLNLVAKTQNLQTFYTLDDTSIAGMINYGYYDEHFEEEILKAREMYNRLNHLRDLPKMIMEKKIYKEDLKSYEGMSRKAAAEKFFEETVLSKLKENVNYEEWKKHIYIQSIAPWSTMDPSHYEAEGIFVVDENGESLTFKECLKDAPLKVEIEQCIIIRVYCDKWLKQDLEPIFSVL
jgi:HD superfamily phosphohydrolase